MKCDKCNQEINTEYGYLKLNGNVYHNGVCLSVLPTYSAAENNICVAGVDLSNRLDYVGIPSMDYKQMKDTIEKQRQDIEQLKSILKRIEFCVWERTDWEDLYKCPICYKHQIHKPDCELAKLLKK